MIEATYLLLALCAVVGLCGLALIRWLEGGDD
jgi:hypothetical protein